MGDRPHHRVTEQEARESVAGSQELDGPHVAVERADALYQAIVPPHPPDLNYLAGRISLSVEEAQHALGIGPYAIKSAIKNGEIPSVKIGGRRLIPVKALERHLEALAYAESGALDAWESALVSAATGRLKRVRRQAWERRKELRRKLRLARRRAAELKDAPGTPREVAQAVVTELASVRADLSAEESLATRVGHDLTKDIEMIQRDFKLNEADLDGERLGQGPKP
jgi:excisionase family DNA binding protein